MRLTCLKVTKVTYYLFFKQRLFAVSPQSLLLDVVFQIRDLVDVGDLDDLDAAFLVDVGVAERGVHAVVRRLALCMFAALQHVVVALG